MNASHAAYMQLLQMLQQRSCAFGALFVSKSIHKRLQFAYSQWFMHVPPIKRPFIEAYKELTI